MATSPGNLGWPGPLPGLARGVPSAPPLLSLAFRTEDTLVPRLLPLPRLGMNTTSMQQQLATCSPSFSPRPVHRGPSEPWLQGHLHLRKAPGLALWLLPSPGEKDSERG